MGHTPKEMVCIECGSPDTSSKRKWNKGGIVQKALEKAEKRRVNAPGNPDVNVVTERKVATGENPEFDSYHMFKNLKSTWPMDIKGFLAQIPAKKEEDKGLGAVLSRERKLIAYAVSTVKSSLEEPTPPRFGLVSGA
ncbi:hypothetical protein Tco_0967133 [Tanacetum coccineum]